MNWSCRPFETDTAAERSQYAAAGIPGCPVVQFDKDRSKISEIEEYRSTGRDAGTWFAWCATAR
jgi:hypothetical protein